MARLTSRNAEREERLKSGASERTDEALLQRVTQPETEVIRRMTFAVKSGIVLKDGTRTRPLAQVTPAYSKPLAQVIGKNEGILPRYADAFDAMARRIERGVSVAQAIQECAAILPQSEASALVAAARLISEGTPISRAIALQGKSLHPIIAPILEVSEREGHTEWAIRQCEGVFRRLHTADAKLDWSVLHPLVAKNVRLDLMVAGASFGVLSLLFPFLIPFFVLGFGGVSVGIITSRKRTARH